EPLILVTDREHAGQARAAGFVDKQVVIVTDAPEPHSRPQPGRAPAPDDLAFLISTSGSTGVPKVVMQTERNILHNVLRYTNGLEIEPDDRIAWLAAISGGQGLATVWTALLNGATLCPFPITERGVTGLSSWLVEQ